MLLRLRALLAYHQASAKDLGRHLKLSANAVGYKINGKQEWKFPSEVMGTLDFFESHGGYYTIEEVFEEYFQ